MLHLREVSGVAGTRPATATNSRARSENTSSASMVRSRSSAVESCASRNSCTAADGVDVRRGARRGRPDPTSAPSAGARSRCPRARSTGAAKSKSTNATARPSDTTTFSRHRSLWHDERAAELARSSGPLPHTGVRPADEKLGDGFVVAALERRHADEQLVARHQAGNGRNRHRAGLELEALDISSRRRAPVARRRSRAGSRCVEQEMHRGCPGLRPGAGPCPRPARPGRRCPAHQRGSPRRVPSQQSG